MHVLVVVMRQLESLLSTKYVKSVFGKMMGRIEVDPDGWTHKLNS